MDELNDNNFKDVEHYDIEIDGETFTIEIEREAELLWLGSKCLSFQDAIWFNNMLVNFDYNSKGFKPWNVPVFNRHIGKDNFIEMMEHFDIDKAKIEALNSISRLQRDCHHWFEKFEISGKTIQKCTKCKLVI